MKPRTTEQLGAGLVLLMFAVLGLAGVVAVSAEPPEILSWGLNTSNQLGYPTAPATRSFAPRAVEVTFGGNGDVRSLSASWEHNLVSFSNGVVKGWGSHGQGRVGTPESLTDFLAVSAGREHGAGIKPNPGGAFNTAWAWGRNHCGQLADPAAGLERAEARPVKGLPPVEILAVDAGNDFTLALTKDLQLWGWGDNSYGQLGTGSAAPFLCEHVHGTAPNPAGPAAGIPTPIPILDQVVQFAAGGNHSLAVTRDGRVWAWGNNLNGQLGSPLADAIRPVPGPVAGLPEDVRAVQAGAAHSIVVDGSGHVWNWGRAIAVGGEGQAIPGTGGQESTSKPIPFQVKRNATQFLEDVAAIAGGERHTLAVTEQGELFAWGSGSGGQLGLGPQTTSSPHATKVMDAVSAVSAGWFHTVALKGPAPTRPQRGASPSPLPMPTVPPMPDPTVPATPNPTDLIDSLKPTPGSSPSPSASPPPLTLPPEADAVPSDPDEALAGTLPKAANKSGVLVTGRNLDTASYLLVCPAVNGRPRCPGVAGAIGPQKFLRRAVAYATGEEPSPKLLFVPNRLFGFGHAPDGSRQKGNYAVSGMQDAGFKHPCPTVPLPPGCFDIAFNAFLSPFSRGTTQDNPPFQKDLNSVDLAEYDGVILGSRITFEELDVLERRNEDLIRYANGGGGLIAMGQAQPALRDGRTHSQLGIHYGVPQCRSRGGIPDAPEEDGTCLSFLPFLDDRYYPLNQFRPDGYSVTEKGREMGLSDADVNGAIGTQSSCHLCHRVMKWFFESCGFDVLDIDKDGRIVSMATKDTIGSCSGLHAPDRSVQEGHSGTRPISFGIALPARSDPLTIDYTTADSSAVTGKDYQPQSGTITIAPGQSSLETVVVQVMGDLEPEEDETFLLKLSGPAIGLEATVAGHILDDDNPGKGSGGPGSNPAAGSDSKSSGSEAQNFPTGASSSKAPASAPGVAPAPVAPAPALGQAVAQANAQAGSQASSHSQVIVPQVGLMHEKEEEPEVEKAGLDANDLVSDNLLATSRRSSPVLAVVLAGAATLVAVALGWLSRGMGHSMSKQKLEMYGPKDGKRQRWVRRLHNQR